MKIIKNNDPVTCRIYGCQFDFTKDDIDYHFDTTWELNVYRSYFVKCPICGAEHKLYAVPIN